MFKISEIKITRNNTHYRPLPHIGGQKNNYFEKKGNISPQSLKITCLSTHQIFLTNLFLTFPYHTMVNISVRSTLLFIFFISYRR